MASQIDQADSYRGEGGGGWVGEVEGLRKKKKEEKHMDPEQCGDCHGDREQGMGDGRVGG